MLNPSLVPTPLVREDERPPVPLEPPRSHRFRRLVVLCNLAWWFLGWLGSRLMALASFLFGWLLAPLGLRPDPRAAAAAAARRLRRTLERLGFLAIKVGQLLSLRTDLFSPELCAELSQLQYRAVGFPVAMAVAAVERELGGPLDLFFSSFRQPPVAAASIAQVHRARLRAEDAEVVIKVMRPGARRIFASDLALLRALVRLLGLIPQLRAFHLHEFVWEVEQIAGEECDYRFELANLETFRKSMRRHRIYVPRPFAAYSTRQVLVMEAIDGALMSDYIAMRQRDPGRLARWLRDNDVDPEQAARRLLLSFLRQLFEDNLFHGDLHPGNVVLLRRSRLALIDLGSLGRADTHMVMRYAMTLEAFASGEFHRGADLTLSFSPQLPLIDLVRVREEMVRALRAWAMRTTVATIPYHERSLSNLFAALTRIMAHSGIATSWGLLRIDRSLTTIDASLHALIPRIDYLALFRRYFREREQRLLRRLLRPAAVLRAVGAAENAVSEFKLFVAPLLRQLSFIFSGGIFASVRAFLLRLAAVASLAAGLFLFAVDMHQLRPAAPGKPPPMLSVERAVESVPPASQPTLVGAQLIAFVLAFSFWRMSSKQELRDTIAGFGRGPG